MNLVGLVAVVLLFGGGTLVVLAFSPIGRALAAKLLGRGAALIDEDDVKKELEQLRGDVAGCATTEELETVRQHLAELAERVDFAERLLAQQREQALPKPRA